MIQCPNMPEKDFSRLASAMVISKEFSEEVLEKDTREKAIKTGFQGEKFKFTRKELSLLKKVAVDGNLDIWKELSEFWTKVNRLREESNL